MSTPVKKEPGTVPTPTGAGAGRGTDRGRLRTFRPTFQPKIPTATTAVPVKKEPEAPKTPTSDRGRTRGTNRNRGTAPRPHQPRLPDTKPVKPSEDNPFNLSALLIFITIPFRIRKTKFRRKSKTITRQICMLRKNFPTMQKHTQNI
jgi:hypothetical protein